MTVEHSGVSKNRSQGTKFNLQIETYKNQLLEYMGSLEWDQKGVSDEKIEVSHPFKEVFDAISIIKKELDTVFDEKKTLENELVKHQDSLEKMIALRTLELEEEIIQKNHVKRINASIFNISNAVNTTQNLDELYQLIHQYLNDIIEVPNFFIGIYHKEKDMITVPYHSDQHDYTISKILNISKKESLSSQVVLNRKPLLLTEKELLDRSINKKMIGHVSKNWMGVPLVSQDKTIGVMAAQSYTDPDYFSDKDLEVLISVSNQVAMAIERQQALDELHEREKKYRRLIETTSAGYWQVDENDKTVAVNRALCDMIGYPRKEIIGSLPYSFFEDRSKANYKRILIKSHQTADRSYELTFVTKAGQLLYTKVDATSIFDEQGQFKGSFAFITDITDRIRAQQELHKAKKKIEEASKTTQTIIENLQAGVVLINVDTHMIELVNPAAAQMFGIPPEKIIGNQCHNFLCPQREGQCPITDLGIKVDNSEKYMLNIHKEKIPILKTVNIIVLNNQKFLLESFVDITEQKKAEEKLINETNRANQMATAAAAASKAKSEFLANMSHEIRTPINGVMGMAEILMDSQLDENQKTLVHTIDSEADALLGIINSILDYSKIEAGKMELEEIGFDLRKMFEDLSDIMNIRANKKGLAFSAFMDTDIPTSVKGDPGRLRQVFMNLVGNALKFTRKGEIFICGKKIAETGQTVCVRFEVEDTGIGIPKEKQSQIFDSFSQADGSTTRKFGGTGLGTTISKQLVELMGGRIGIESQKDKGSTFWFEVIFKKDKKKSITNEWVHDLAKTGISGITVLVIDAKRKDRLILSNYLESFGCNVITANGSDAGFHILKKQTKDTPIDLILTDFYLKTTDGFEFAQTIRASGVQQNIPIILMSSMGAIGDAKQCRQLGINGYLSKPVKKLELQIAILSTLGMNDFNTKENKPLVTRHFINESLKKIYTVLVAEDYPTNQKIVLKHLYHAGFKVVLAKNGVQAISQYKKKPFDLILMDIQMPKMDGYEATRQIRQIETHLSKKFKQSLRTPIVAMTAHAMQGYREKCLAADMDDYITKPLKKNDLISMVKKWVEKSLVENHTIKKSIRKDTPQIRLPIDMSKALSEFENDEVFLNDVLSDFIGHVKSQLEQMQTVLNMTKTGTPDHQTIDFDTIEKQGHAIKGGAANLTAFDLSNAAFKVEKAGKEKDYDRVSNRFKQLKFSYNTLCQYIRLNHKQIFMDQKD